MEIEIAEVITSKDGPKRSITMTLKPPTSTTIRPISSGMLRVLKRC